MSSPDAILSFSCCGQEDTDRCVKRAILVHQLSTLNRRPADSRPRPAALPPARPARPPVNAHGRQVSRTSDAAAKPPEKRARVWDALLQRAVDAEEFDSKDTKSS